MLNASTLVKRSQNRKPRVLLFRSSPPVICPHIATLRPLAVPRTAANRPSIAQLAPCATTPPRATGFPAFRPNRHKCWLVAATCVRCDRRTPLQTNTKTITPAPMDTRRIGGTDRPALRIAARAVSCLVLHPGRTMISQSWARKLPRHRLRRGLRSRRHHRPQ